MTSPYDTLGASPVAGEAAAGRDVRSEDDFMSLQDELDKIGNPTASGPPDWARVEQLAVGLLANVGKDLLVACYLTVALIRRHSMRGLADGLHVVDDLLSHWWDTLFPPPARMRARRNALQWLNEQISDYLTGIDRDVPLDGALAAAVMASLQSIDARLAEVDAGAPGTRSLQTLMRGLPVIEQIAPPPVSATLGAPPASPGAPAAVSPASGSRAPVPDSAPLESGTVESLAGVDLEFERLAQRLVSLAALLRANASSDPRAYRLNRIAAWDAIDAAPPASLGQTMVPSPIAPIVEAFERMRSQSLNEELIKFAETQLFAFPFWLDLNRASSEALGRLGDAHRNARAEVDRATAQWLARVPTLADLAFADGRPFADGDTTRWLATLHPAGDALGAQPPDAPARDPLAEVLGNARASASEGNLERAAAMLDGAANGAPAPVRLRARILLCELLQAHRPNMPLLPFAQLLIDDLDAHRLETWAPALALDALRAAYAITSQAERRADADALLVRIARLDAAAAIRLVSPSA